MKAIETNKLTRYYKDYLAVNEITFSVEPGTVFGFLGPNGAGKTTTIKMLTGQLRPTSGTAQILGMDVVDEIDQIKPRIGVVFEHQNIYLRLTGRENLRFTAQLYGVDSARIDEVLKKVNLLDRADDRAKAYSNGMKQRLLIARALLHQPAILFLDEPTKGLDPGVARSIRRIVTNLREEGVTVFLTTHYMEEADQLSDTVAILHEGSLVAIDSPGKLKSQYGGKNASLEEVFLTLTGNELYI